MTFEENAKLWMHMTVEKQTFSWHIVMFIPEIIIGWEPDPMKGKIL